MHTYHIRRHYYFSTKYPSVFYLRDPGAWLPVARYSGIGRYSYAISHPSHLIESLFLHAAFDDNPYFMSATLKYYDMTPVVLERCCITASHSGNVETLMTFIGNVHVKILEHCLLEIYGRWHHQRCRTAIASELQRRINNKNEAS